MKNCLIATCGSLAGVYAEAAADDKRTQFCQVWRACHLACHSDTDVARFHQFSNLVKYIKAGNLSLPFWLKIGNRKAVI